MHEQTVAYGRIRHVWGAAIGACRHGFDGFSNWLMSVVATLLLPAIPILTEYYKGGAVSHDTFYITGVILASTFLFTAEHNFLRFCYIILLAFSLAFDMLVPAKGIPASMTSNAGAVVLAVGMLHAGERFWWHVIDDRPFPEKRGIR